MFVFLICLHAVFPRRASSRPQWSLCGRLRGREGARAPLRLFVSGQQIGCYIPTLSRGESAAARSHHHGAKQHKLKPSNWISDFPLSESQCAAKEEKKGNVFVVFPEALFFPIHVAANVLRLRSHFQRLKAVNTAHLISALECIWAEITAKWLHNKNSCWWLSGINQRQSTLCCRCRTNGKKFPSSRRSDSSQF